MTDPTSRQTQTTGQNPYNALLFLARALLNKASFATIVKVVNVSVPPDVLEPVGFVDVQPCVNLLDGAQQAVEHDTIYGLPYLRLQGGANAIVIDPSVGDLGLCVFADRDISAVKANRDIANPGSNRRNSWSDGMYFGGLLNGIPEQYIQFTSTGIRLISPTGVQIVAPTITLQGAIVFDGVVTGGTDVGDTIHIGSPIISTAPITAPELVWGDDTSATSHVHSSSGGSGNGGPPVSGS